MAKATMGGVAQTNCRIKMLRKLLNRNVYLNLQQRDPLINLYSNGLNHC